jgi:hypothetical protein
LCKDSSTALRGETYRNIYIVESREGFVHARGYYDPTLDLVLTYDFGLRREIELLGGKAYYVDHLCDPSVMQENNYLMYQFFRDWHFDTDGADIFRYREIDFGFSLRIEIWNDFTFYARSRLCLEQLKVLHYKAVYLGEGLDLLKEVLRDMEVEFKQLKSGGQSKNTYHPYFFPIHRWMDERLRTRRVRHVIRDIAVTVQGIAMSWFDRLAHRICTERRIFIQEYHPTRLLLQKLLSKPGIRVVQGHFSSARGWKKYLRERPIPVYGSVDKKRSSATSLIEAFRLRRSALFILSTGVDVTSAVNRVIERRIAEVLPRSLRSLDCVIHYLDKHPIDLEILIGNLGQLAMLVDCVAKSRNVPSYIIINGLLGNDYLDEAKYGTVINAYSTSIRDNYFKGMDNIVCLGDPRMDIYSTAVARTINRFIPTITIGASGFNNVDLNSYLAVEFEFLYEVLSAIRNVAAPGQKIRTVLKVRANGYIELYRHFSDEYFPGMVDQFVDDAPMRTVLDKTDLFISIYSQTLFEASCLGIPVIYHKTDREIMDPPFDGKSELVTTKSVSELESAISDFLAEDNRFDAFMRRNVMEKYIGPLDGNNLERNIQFIEILLSQKGAEAIV